MVTVYKVKWVEFTSIQRGVLEVFRGTIVLENGTEQKLEYNHRHPKDRGKKLTLDNWDKRYFKLTIETTE